MKKEDTIDGQLKFSKIDTNWCKTYSKNTYKIHHLNLYFCAYLVCS